MQKIYPRDEKNHYFTGLPCLRGHISWRGSDKRCSECRKNSYQLRHKKWRLTEPYSQLLKNAYKRAKRKNIPYNLTLEWAKARWTGRCELSGIPFDLSFNGERAGCYMPSLDRIDNLIGYTESNCRFILYALNAFKGELSDKELFSIAAALIAHKG